MKLSRLYFLFLIHFFLTANTPLKAEEAAAPTPAPAAVDVKKFPFKLGRLDPDGQPIQFNYNKEQNLLTFIHHAEFRTGSKQGKRLETTLYFKDQTTLEAKNACHFHSRLFFLPVLFQNFVPEKIEQVESFSTAITSCDPLEDAHQQTESEIKGNVSLNQLKQNLDDPDWMVRVQAIRALETKAPDSISLLKESLGAIDLGQREYAAVALERINTDASKAALGGYQGATPDFTSGESTWVTKDGLSLDVKATQNAFPFGSMLSFDLTLKNSTEKVMSVYDPPMCDLSWAFKIEDLKHGGKWIGYFPRTYEVVSPQPVYLKAGESFIVRCPVDLFYWKASQDVETPVSRWDVWERHLPEGKYQMRATVTLGLPYVKPDSAYMFWIGSLESKPAAFEVTPKKLLFPDKSKWTTPIEKMQEANPKLGVWKAMIETSRYLADENSSIRLKSIQFLSALVGILDLEQRKEFLPMFMDLFSDEDPGVRHLISEVLSGLQMNPVSSLEKSLKNFSSQIMEKDYFDSAMWTVRTLKKLRTPESDKALSEYALELKNHMLQTTDGDLKAAYMELLEEIGGKKIEALFVEGTTDSHPQMRADSAVMLGILRSRQSIDILIGLLEDQNEDVVAAASYSLLSLATPASEDAVMFHADRLIPILMKQCQSEYARNRLRAVSVIKAFGPKASKATAALIDLLASDPVPQIRLLAYKTLEGIGSSEAKKAMVQYKGKADVKDQKSVSLPKGTQTKKNLEETPEPPQKLLKDYVYAGRTSAVMRGDVLSPNKLGLGEVTKTKPNADKAKTPPPKLTDGKAATAAKERQPGDFEKLKQQALFNERPSLREAAASELAEFGDEAIPVLEKAMKDSEFHVRFSARLALIKIGTPAAKEAAKLKSKKSANAKDSTPKTT